MNKKILIVMLIIVAILAGGTFVYINGIGEDNQNNKNGNQEMAQKNEDTFKVVYKGVDITPGMEFKKDSINEEAEYTELQSCAFEGTDKVFTYEGVEITASLMNGKETVYSVYFLNETSETVEDVKITDKKSTMIEKYGEDYEELGNQITYTKGNVSLCFIVENDVITSIEYVYIIQ